MTLVAEPVYPLGREAFVRALATGHGRAMIQVERYGSDGLRDEILDAAIHPKVYDSQCNGHGATWLARMCGMAKLVDRVISETGGSSELRASMLIQFGRSGHPEARSALREMCRNDPESNDLSASCEIVDLEGEEGYLFVVERAGEALLKHSEYWVSDVLEWVLDQRLGEGSALAILDRESRGSPNIAAYREAVVAYRARLRSEPEPTSLPVEQVIERILTSTKRIWRLRIFGENASLEDRRKIAALDFTTMDPIALQNYLCYFGRSGFPEFRQAYLSLLTHPEERVRWSALSALSHHAEPQVRQAAHEALARGEVALFVGLLHRSGRSDDTEPLLRAINDPRIVNDDDEAHGVVGPLEDLVKDNGNLNDLRLPLWIYENSPCRICRFHAVEIMAERSILPRWIAEECLSDAYDDTRAIAAKHLGVEQRF